MIEKERPPRKLTQVYIASSSDPCRLQDMLNRWLGYQPSWWNLEVLSVQVTPLRYKMDEQWVGTITYKRWNKR
jgi:hypothetical protein